MPRFPNIPGMPYHLQHLHLPHIDIHRKRRPHGSRWTRRIRLHDIEAQAERAQAGDRVEISLPTNVRPIDDAAISDDSPPESHITYRILPIFSGVMVPFAVMLSIPGLTGHWYIRTVNNRTIETQANPILLDIGLFFSMACAVLASIFLIVRFAERHVKLATLASIGFLTLHDLINIPAVTYFGVAHRFDDGFTYGQSFWFTVCSTVVSTVTNITLIIDFVTTKDFAHAGSGLTQKQRSLVIIVMVLLTYISLGSFIEAKLLKISFLDALYFSIVSLETIGFGDIYPETAGSRVFTCFYIVGGILNIALAVTISRDVVLESTVIEFRQRLKAQHHERRLRSRWRAAIRWRLRERGLPTWVHHHRHDAPEDNPHHLRWFDWFSRVFESISSHFSRETEDPAWKYQMGSRHKRLNLEALSDADWNAAALETGAPLTKLIPEELRLRRQGTQECTEVPLSTLPTIEPATSHSLTHVRLGGMLAILGNFAIAVSQITESDSDLSANTTESNAASITQPEPPRTSEKSPEQTWNSPRSAMSTDTTPSTLDDDLHADSMMERETKKMVNVRLYIAFSLFLTFWMVGSAIFMKTEGWTFWSAAYFCFVAFTTVGYGDLSPKTAAGVSIFVVWALLGVATMTILIAVLAEAYSQRYQHVIKTEANETSSTTPSIRPTLSEHPTFMSTADQGLVSSSSSNYPRLGGRSGGVSGPRIRIQENTIFKEAESGSKESPTVDNSQSVHIQVDHLKSLITVARAQNDSRESDTSSQLHSMILDLEKKLLDAERCDT